MTTIAFRAGVLACDKQSTDGNIRCKGVGKAVETEDLVYVVSGNLSCGLTFIDHLVEEREGDLPDLDKVEIIVFDKNTGKVVMYESGSTFPIPIEDPFYAYGSGSSLALGAMAMGADAEKAVKIASKFDVYTGGGVQVWYSKKAKKRLADV